MAGVLQQRLEVSEVALIPAVVRQTVAGDQDADIGVFAERPNRQQRGDQCGLAVCRRVENE